MTELRSSIVDILPARMAGRPVDHRGYPVPWFVTVKDEEGRWNFRHYQMIVEPQIASLCREHC